MFVARSACGGRGGFYFVCILWHVSNLRLIHGLLIVILLLSPPWALRRPHRSRLCYGYCPDISYFHSMTISCPSGLCLSASLPLVTSQARLESDVLNPQPGVTAGFCRMFQALGGQDRYPAVLITSLSRLVLVLWLRFLGSQAPSPLFYSNYNISCPYGFIGASPFRWLPVWLG